ncbi:MAG: hypothetical protein QM790_07925 [Nibricoccus sp.]
MFNEAKDALTSRAAQSWANNFIERYGRVESLKIDSRNKSIEITCVLEGESSPITVNVANYEVETSGGKRFIRGTDFRCSRPWLQKFLQDFGPSKRFELPGWATAAF